MNPWRGNLSLAALRRFTGWFVEVCLDKVTYITRMLRPKEMSDRLSHYAASQDFRFGGSELLRAVLIRGQVERGGVATILGIAPRTAIAAIKELSNNGILGAETPQSALQLHFIGRTLEVLFPRILES